MRSLLFVPGDSSRKLEKAANCSADALIIDLEDAVSADNKAHARQSAASFLSARQERSVPRLYVRINAFDTGLTDTDLAAIIPARPDGVILPKCDAGADVSDLHNRLSVLEATNGIADGEIEIVAITGETAASLLHLQGYRDCSPRLAALTWGSEDLAADIGASRNRGPDGQFTAPFGLARNLILLAAAAAGVPAIDTVFANYRDLEGLRAECLASSADGFIGKLAIHPDQVEIINDAYTPTPEAIARAERIVDLVETSGDGVGTVDGQMVDHAHLKRAKAVLERAGQAAGYARKSDRPDPD